VVKRQISDRELLAIRVGVGVIVTVLIYVLSVAWTCGFSQVFSVILSQLQKDFLAYGLFLYFGLGYFNFWLFYNLIELLLWRRGLRSDFVPKYPPSETNSEWTIITKIEWNEAMAARLFLWMPLWFFFVWWVFSHNAQRFCTMP
jgi:hypothetical protein